MFNIKEHEIETCCQGTVISVDGGGNHVETVDLKVTFTVPVTVESRDAIDLDDVRELVKTMFHECRIDHDAFDERSTNEDVDVV